MRETEAHNGRVAVLSAVGIEGLVAPEQESNWRMSGEERDGIHCHHH